MASWFVKAEDVKATFENGVLEVAVRLPPAKKEPKARRVEIQEAAENRAKSAA